VIGEGTHDRSYCIIGGTSLSRNCNLIAHVPSPRRPHRAGCTIYPFVSLGTRHIAELQGRTDPARDRAGCTIRNPHHERRPVAAAAVTRVGERGYFMIAAMWA